MSRSKHVLRAKTREAAARAPWNAEVGRCRALRLGDHVWVTGSSPERADGHVYRRGDAQGQAARCLDVIEQALRRVDAGMGDVVRTSVFITDVRCWGDVQRALRERFPGHPPSEVVEVDRLPNPDMLVEIEAEAFVVRPAS
jgi:isochorismate pyruvate lyase